MTASWKTWLWRSAITAAILVLLAAVFYAVENSRGLRAWDKCERELTARGENLKWNDFIPPAVPDEENFFKAPMMTEWFIKNTNGAASISFNKSLSNPENTTNIITELSASNYLAWSDGFAAEFEQIRAATKRPAARMDGNYDRPFNQPVPNFVSYRIASQVLAHRAKCHLLLEQPTKALDDLSLLHQLNRTLGIRGHSDFLVTAMIHCAISGLYADAVACGLNSEIWRDEEVKELQKQLSEIHLLEQCANAIRSERAGICHLLDTISSEEIVRMMSFSSKPRSAENLGLSLIPQGWIHQNKTVIAKMQQQMIEGVTLTNRTVSPRTLKSAANNIERMFTHTTPWNFIAGVCIPSFNKAAITMARNQTAVDQAQIVCALERYRLAKGEYPAGLADLSPQFLDRIPTDIISGNPMNYRRTDAQNFKLWSIGWNEVDESGTTIHSSDGKEDREAGDWVWQYPAI